MTVASTILAQERCFRECFDMAPMQYVNTLRIRKSERLLRDRYTRPRCDHLTAFLD